MIARLTNNPIGSLLLKSVLLGLLLVKILMFEVEEINSFAYSLVEFSFPLNGWVLKISLIVGYLLSMFLLLKMNSKYRFVEFDTSPLWLFAITGFILFPIESLHLNVAVSMILNVLGLGILLQIYHQPSVGTLVFSATCLITVATIIFYPSIIFLLLVVATLFAFRSFNLKSYLLIFVGFMLPLFYLLSINYLTESNWIGTFTPITLAKINFNVLERNLWPFLCFLPLIGLSLVKLITYQSKFIVRQRNQLIIIFFFTLLTFGLGLVVDLENVLFFMLLPIGLFYNYWYQFFAKKWVLDTILITLIITSFFVK